MVSHETKSDVLQLELTSALHLFDEFNVNQWLSES